MKDFFLPAVITDLFEFSKLLSVYEDFSSANTIYSSGVGGGYAVIRNTTYSLTKGYGAVMSTRLAGASIGDSVQLESHCPGIASNRIAGFVDFKIETAGKPGLIYFSLNVWKSGYAYSFAIRINTTTAAIEFYNSAGSWETLTGYTCNFQVSYWHRILLQANLSNNSYEVISINNRVFSIGTIQGYRNFLGNLDYSGLAFSIESTAASQSQAVVDKYAFFAL